MTVEERVRTVLERDAALIPRGDPLGAAAAMRRGGRRRLINRIGVSISIIVGLVALVYLVIPSSNAPVAGAGIDLSDVPSPAEVLADRVVTSVEWNTAGQAVVQCLSNRGIEATFHPEDGAFDLLGNGVTQAFDECRSRYLSGSMERVWADQNYDPAAEFEFYNSVVECTEARTGIDYGEMTQGLYGSISTDAHRTINRALDEAPGIYEICFGEVAGSP